MDKKYGMHLFLGCLIALILMNSLGTYAQKYAIGVRAGAILSTNAFGDKEDKLKFTNSWKQGYFVAAFANLPLKDNFSFQTEAGFSRRGRRIKFNDDTWTNKAGYSFLDASMMLRKSHYFNWTDKIRGTWFINVGPKVSYWLGGSGKVISGGTYIDPISGAIKTSEGGFYKYHLKFAEEPIEPTTSDFNIMYMRDVNRWLFGIDFGIGVDAPTAALQRFVIEFRFTTMHTYYGSKFGAFNRTLGFEDNLKANEKIFSLSIDYALNRELREGKKGKSTSKESKNKNSRHRKSFNSMIH